MKFYQFIVLIFFFGTLQAQTHSEIRHPNEIRKEIYSFILKDIKSKNKQLPIKHILLDHTINKYNNISANTFGIVLEDEELSIDSSICSNFDNVKCVDPLAINAYSLNKIYQVHKDEDYADFYGIYAPVDKWYKMIYSIAKNTLELEKSNNFEINIPVRNVYFKNGNIVEHLIMYQFSYNGNLSLVTYKSTNL